MPEKYFKLTKPAFTWLKYSKNNNIVKKTFIYYLSCLTVFSFNIQ